MRCGHLDNMHLHNDWHYDFFFPDEMLSSSYYHTFIALGSYTPPFFNWEAVATRFWDHRSQSGDARAYGVHTRDKNINI